MTQRGRVTLSRRSLLGAAASGALLMVGGYARAAAKAVTKVKITANDAMSYSTRKIEVPAGTKVELTLTHTGKLPKAGMGHNVVILKQGTNKKAFANMAMAASKTDYIPPKMKDAIIAHTKLLGGGESDTITFDAPAPGEYDYLCSFPGHYVAMSGKLIVKEA